MTLLMKQMKKWMRKDNLNNLRLQRKKGRKWRKKLTWLLVTSSSLLSGLLVLPSIKTHVSSLMNSSEAYVRWMPILQNIPSMWSGWVVVINHERKTNICILFFSVHYIYFTFFSSHALIWLTKDICLVKCFTQFGFPFFFHTCIIDFYF